MAIETSELTLELRDASSAPASARNYTGMAVMQAGRWVAVCRELGTVAEGANADQALDALDGAIRDVLEVAREDGLESGIPVPSDEIRRLILEHGTGAPITFRNFVL